MIVVDFGPAALHWSSLASEDVDRAVYVMDDTDRMVLSVELRRSRHPVTAYQPKSLSMTDDCILDLFRDEDNNRQFRNETRMPSTGVLGMGYAAMR
jgi:hypothetical protein